MPIIIHEIIFRINMHEKKTFRIVETPQQIVMFMACQKQWRESSQTTGPASRPVNHGKPADNAANNSVARHWLAV